MEFERKPVRLRDRHALPLTALGAIMDLNYLYHRHGVSLLMADRAVCEPSRSAHRTLAGAYAGRIAAALRQAHGVAA